MSKRVVRMKKPDGSEVLVYSEDVEHRESLGWTVVTIKKKAGKTKSGGK